MTALALRELATEEVRRRTFWRGETKEAARALGLSQSYITAFKNGTVRMTDKAAARILAAAREEELRLADKVERELNAHWYKERREARQEEHRARAVTDYPQVGSFQGENGEGISSENQSLKNIAHSCG